MEKILNRLGYFKKKKLVYCQICYSAGGTPEDNSKQLIELMAEGNQWMQPRLNADHDLLGVLFSVILYVEFHLVKLISSIYDDAEKLTFGPKIEVYKDFLDLYEFFEEGEEKQYRMLLQPLHEIKNIRNLLAHNVNHHSFESGSLRQTEAYIKKIDPTKFKLMNECKTDKDRCEYLLMIFGTVCAFELAKIRMKLAR